MEAALAPGQSIGLDFGNNAGANAAPAGWNAVSNNGGILDLIEITSSSATGVSLTYDAPTNFFNDDSGQTGSANSPSDTVGPTPSPFTVAVAEDWSGTVDNGNSTTNSVYAFTLGGLSDASVGSYEVSILVGAWTATGVVDFSDVTINGQTQNYGDIDLDGVVLTFTGVVPNAGEISVTINGANGGVPTEVNVISGLYLTAIEAEDEDSDNDGLPDDYELGNFGDLDETAEGDFDEDGLTNGDELLAETDPTDTDSDGDSLLDGAEVNTHGTNPLLADTDGDTIEDFEEINTFGTNPNSADSDGDELTDADELVNRNTDPNIADSDNDGASDGLEVVSGFNPNSSTSTPPSDLALAGMTSPGVVGPLLDGSLPAVTPVDSTGDSFERQTALPNVTFNQALGIVTEPRSNHLVVIERDGRLQQVEYDPDTETKNQILILVAEWRRRDWGD